MTGMRLLLILLLLASFSSLASAVTINWSTVQTSTSVTLPTNALGAPDGKSASLSPSGLLTASQFLQSVNYSDTVLANALNLASLPIFNVIVLEFNGTPGQGWEGSQFTFTDGGPVVTMQINSGATVGIPNFVVAAGAISLSNYLGVFGTAATGAADIPYLLLNVPGVNVGLASFQVSINGFGGTTPDPDAIGIVQGVPEPGSALLVVSALGALLYRLRRGSSASTALIDSRHPK